MAFATDSSLLRAVRAALAELADSERAAQQQRYMKSAMPYHGVAMGDVRAIGARLCAQVDISGFEDWRREVLGLWSGARFREERYVAIQLCGERRAKAHQTLRALPLYEQLIVEGAWWDLVDELAIHRLGALLQREPAPMRRELVAWSRCDNLWKRRSAIVSQVRAKARTDFELLAACIEPALESNEFFLRKAIGWALRSYADVDAPTVRAYVERHAERLSGLSKREALRKIGG